MANLQAELAQPTGLESSELHRISLDVYRSMGELGLLLPDDRVELLDGLLVKKMTKGPRHVTATQRLVKYLDTHLPAGWSARKEDPIELPGGPERADSAPEPDVAVVRGGLADYSARHPGPADVALVVEVAGSPGMLARDPRGLARYAWAGIPVVWIVNLTNETVEVQTTPTGMGPDPHYDQRVVKGRGTDLPIVLGEEVVSVPIEIILS
jgi:Uma2 family endonuclease